MHLQRSILSSYGYVFFRPIRVPFLSDPGKPGVRSTTKHLKGSLNLCISSVTLFVVGNGKRERRPLTCLHVTLLYTCNIVVAPWPYLGPTCTREDTDFLYNASETRLRVGFASLRNKIVLSVFLIFLYPHVR